MCACVDTRDMDDAARCIALEDVASYIHVGGFGLWTEDTRSVVIWEGCTTDVRATYVRRLIERRNNVTQRCTADGDQLDGQWIWVWIRPGSRGGRVGTHNSQKS